MDFHTGRVKSTEELLTVWDATPVKRQREQPTKKKERYVFSHSVTLDSFATLWTVARQVPLSLGFSKQEYWSGVPFRPPGDLPNPGIEPTSLCLLHWQADSLPLHHLREFINSCLNLGNNRLTT